MFYINKTYFLKIKIIYYWLEKLSFKFFKKKCALKGRVDIEYYVYLSFTSIRLVILLF